MLLTLDGRLDFPIFYPSSPNLTWPYNIDVIRFHFDIWKNDKQFKPVQDVMTKPVGTVCLAPSFSEAFEKPNEFLDWKDRHTGLFFLVNNKKHEHK